MKFHWGKHSKCHRETLVLLIVHVALNSLENKPAPPRYLSHPLNSQGINSYKFPSVVPPCLTIRRWSWGRNFQRKAGNPLSPSFPPPASLRPRTVQRLQPMEQEAIPNHSMFTRAWSWGCPESVCVWSTVSSPSTDSCAPEALQSVLEFPLPGTAARLW